MKTINSFLGKGLRLRTKKRRKALFHLTGNRNFLSDKNNRHSTAHQNDRESSAYSHVVIYAIAPSLTASCDFFLEAVFLCIIPFAVA